MSDTTSKDDDLIESLVERVGNRRFDSDYQGGSHRSNRYVIEQILPLIKQYGIEQRLDELNLLPIRTEENEWDAVDILNETLSHFETRVKKLTALTHNKTDERKA